MKQLTKATGVTKATVQHCIRQGLVPRPIKAHRNMACYDQSHVDAIRMVRGLQAKRFLPLSVTLQVMKGGRGGVSLRNMRIMQQHGMIRAVKKGKITMCDLAGGQKRGE